ncbi:Outer membrane protein assembly factor BamB precursor [Pirellula sp. SH-Sr6A]|uniref:outer membrane protein assembly factor BamB family protein n=1 Tax=Pirellula sp. SH-Sr6A TaxID=1632865 RepID=UPI00078DD222|nr:PQQ-binding-like beta-propeller repeat protein [Pirellula sp. SH-Sr6A]AMV34989.1 Outer membrane protein assembly factor BamB precursor [Pirellula sp. SH-Sr6A]
MHFRYFLIGILSLSGSLLGQDPRWPAFLGAGSTPPEAALLPIVWSPEQSIAWKMALKGHGQSSPILWEKRIFVTTVDGPNKERQLVHCMSLQDGQILWTHEVPNENPVKNSVYVSRAAPTPVVDADRVVVFFESGDCIAVDHQGENLWSRNLSKDYGPFIAEFGLGASPCQNADHVFVLMEHDAPGALVALSKKTGQTVWKAERAAGRSWSSPAYFKIDGIEQVVVSSNGSVMSYDCATGKVLWELTGLGGNTNVSPIDNGSGRFLIGASPGRQGENAESAKKSNGMVQVKKVDGVWKPELVWWNDKVSPTWGSPIIHQDLAYWVNRVGVVHCLDTKDGEVVYTGRLKQACWATPIAIDDRIYFFGKEGITTVIQAGRAFKILAENTLFDLETLPPETTTLGEEGTEERRRAAAMLSGPTLYGSALAGSTMIARIGNQVFAMRSE